MKIKLLLILYLSSFALANEDALALEYYMDGLNDPVYKNMKIEAQQQQALTSRVVADQQIKQVNDEDKIMLVKQNKPEDYTVIPSKTGIGGMFNRFFQSRIQQKGI